MVREPTGRVAFSLIDVAGQRIAETELVDDPAFALARVTISPDGEHVAAYVASFDRPASLDIDVRRIDTGDISNLTDGILQSSCAVSDPANCPCTDQRTPVWSRPLR